MYLFDNDATVYFAIFVSFWAALFLEFWRRYSSEIAHRWDVMGYQPEEEHPRPEYLAQLRNVEEKTVNFVTQTTEPKAGQIEHCIAPWLISRVFFRCPSGRSSFRAL